MQERSTHMLSYPEVLDNICAMHLRGVTCTPDVTPRIICSNSKVACMLLPDHTSLFMRDNRRPDVLEQQCRPL